MKIKTQSYILIAGVALMPVLVILSSLLITNISFKSREAARYEEFQKEKRISESGNPEEAVRLLLAHTPPDMKVAVVNPSGRVSYSNIEGLPAGSILDSRLSKAELTAKDNDRIIFVGFGPQMPSGYTLISSLPRNNFLPSQELERVIVTGIIALALILAFAATMCILIVSSMTKSVLSLDAATKRVANGELDTVIEVEGSNEIASLARSLNSLREQIKEDQARQSRFIMSISHDLKTPLSLVKGYAEATGAALGELELEGGADGDRSVRATRPRSQTADAAIEAKAEKYLEIIEAKADQLEGMIDDLIDFMRLNTGEWSRGLKDILIGPFLESFIRRIQADANLLGRSARGKIELPTGIMVKMDERLMTRALENLAYNGLRYTPQGGEVIIEACMSGNTIRLTVSDDGPGVAPEDLPHIFEAFYRGTSSRREQGMGLGLSIVKTVVESHGWDIEVESPPAGGVAFTMVIPVR